MAPGYVVAVVLEVSGLMGLVAGLFLIRRERLSKCAGLRGRFGSGGRRSTFRPRIVAVTLRPGRVEGVPGVEATARAALRRAVLAA